MNAEDIHVDVQNIPAYDVCADETFDSPAANRRTGEFLRTLTPEERIMRSLDVVGVVGAYMAGTRCPTPARLTDLVHDVSDIREWEKWSVRELFNQMDPLECVEFMWSTDASPREMARLLRTCRVRRAEVVTWINQYSSDPNWEPDHMLMIQWAERHPRARPVDGGQ